MPVFLNWLLRLLPTNPICMRLVQGGSRRMRHLYIRAGYLALMIVVLLFVLITATGSGNIALRDLAKGGASMFVGVSYLQVGLICLLTPVFMAGAIAQEANPHTWDIMLTTPLSSLQVVLGNLFGRLFFVIALLFSSLPLFAVTQYFGGVPGTAIFASYAIAGSSSLLVAAIAVALSVTRTAGRRAVFVFYISVVMYLFITYAIDYSWRDKFPVGATSARYTTPVTPLNPFLALEVLLYSNEYQPRSTLDYPDSMWLVQMWMTRPIAAFCWLCVWVSVVLIAWSTLSMRIIGTKVGTVPWYRRMLGLGAKGASERPARTVGHNPVTWREATARGKTLGALAARYGFIALGVLVAVLLVTLHRTGLWTTRDLQLGLMSVVSAEIVIIALAALNMSATAVSREREDGTLDIILTTPIQPGPYLAGKLRGLIMFLLPMISVPVITVIIMSIYVMTNGLGYGESTVMLNKLPLATSTNTISLPFFLPEGPLALMMVLPPFVAFCVMVGLHWSIKSKGTIGSVIAAVTVVLAIMGVLSLCGFATNTNFGVIGGVCVTFSPINLMYALVYPNLAMPGALTGNEAAGRIAVLVGAGLTAAIFAMIVYGLHNNQKRTFMMTVRKLAGQA